MPLVRGLPIRALSSSSLCPPPPDAQTLATVTIHQPAQNAMEVDPREAREHDHEVVSSLGRRRAALFTVTPPGPWSFLVVAWPR